MYGENSGDIWSIAYYLKKKVEIPDDEKQKLLDSQTRELGNTFDPPPGLSSNEYSNLFLNHFLKARSQSREIIEKSGETRVRIREDFQIGNQECLDELLRIETLPNFEAWENPHLVDFFRQTSEENL
jgi:hypothetical protein